MPENNEEIRVVLSAFDSEARKWEELADTMARLRGTAMSLGLAPLAFFCANPVSAKQLGDAYDDVLELVKTLMADAEAEFDQLAGAMRIARDLYDGSDQVSAAALVKIYGQ